MRLLCCVLALMIFSDLVVASEDNEENSSTGLARVMLEGSLGAIFNGDNSGIKTEPALGLDIGFGIPLNRFFLLEALAGYKIATTSQFDLLLHGPQLSAFIMAEPIHHFALGVGTRGGLDWRQSVFQGGWLSFDAKMMIGFISLFEVGLQGGPRLAIYKDKTSWGGELFAIGGLIF